MLSFRPLRRVPWPHPRSMPSGLPLSCHWLVQPLSSIVPRRSDVQPATSSGKYSPTGSSKMRASGRISSGSFASAATISSVRSGHFSMAMGRSVECQRRTITRFHEIGMRPLQQECYHLHEFGNREFAFPINTLISHVRRVSVRTHLYYWRHYRASYEEGMSLRLDREQAIENAPSERRSRVQRKVHWMLEKSQREEQN